jgi:hypothetical protein
MFVRETRARPIALYAFLSRGQWMFRKIAAYPGDSTSVQ